MNISQNQIILTNIEKLNIPSITTLVEWLYAGKWTIGKPTIKRVLKV